MQTIKENIVLYWHQRAEDFAALREKELSCRADRWEKEIKKYLPPNRKLRVLDVGCGSGFFSILLAGLGHRVTGIDLTPKMIQKAETLSKEMEQAPEFFVMDAEKLQFADASFDLVITRNLTWTLPNVQSAYKEWQRVLRQGGLLLNFDADYAAGQENPNLPENHAHKTMPSHLQMQCESIQEQLQISYLKRPAWDVQVLIESGFSEIKVDMNLSKRVYPEVDEFYNPVPMFTLAAYKH